MKLFLNTIIISNTGKSLFYCDAAKNIYEIWNFLEKEISKFLIKKEFLKKN